MNDECVSETEESNEGDVDCTQSQLELVAKQQEEVHSNYSMLSSQFLSAMDQFKQLLTQREEAFLSGIAAVRDYKLAALEKYQAALEGVGQGKPLSEVAPSLAGGLSCGFLPEFASLALASASLVTAPSDDVHVGDDVLVNVIGGMSSEGSFWVRVLPDQLQIKDIILRNISNCLQVQLEQSFVPLSSPSPGDTCAVKYSRDGIWYRGRVATSPHKNRVSVFFMDYGNTEEMSLSSLAPLHEGFLVFPSQMQHCTFSAQPSSVSREGIGTDVKRTTGIMRRFQAIITQHQKTPATSG